MTYINIRLHMILARLQDLEDGLQALSQVAPSASAAERRQAARELLASKRAELSLLRRQLQSLAASAGIVDVRNVRQPDAPLGKAAAAQGPGLQNVRGRAMQGQGLRKGHSLVMGLVANVDFLLEGLESKVHAAASGHADEE